MSLHCAIRAANLNRCRVESGGRFLWGHELDIWKAAVGSKYTEWFNKFGPVYRVKGALFHPDIVSASFQFKAPPARPIIGRLVGEGIIWAEGEQHKRFRRLMDSIFSAASTKRMTPDVLNVCSRLQTRLSQYLQDNGGDAVINMKPWTSAATLDIIGFVGFGYDFRLGESPEAKAIISAWAEQVKLGLGESAFFAEMVLRAFPRLLSIPLPALEAQGKIRRIIAELASRIMEDARAGGDVSQGYNFLDAMMKATGEGRMTTQETIDNNRSLAAYETTAGTLDFMLYELAKNPACQQKLRDELHAFGGEPTYDDFERPDRLCYLDAVVKEGLRMYPAAVHNARVTNEEDVMPLEKPVRLPSGEVISEIHVPAGQIVYTPHLSIQRMEGIWKDGDSFKPERWVEPGGLPPREQLPTGWSNLLTFNAGPRLCLGYRLGKCFILFSLISNFVFHDTAAKIDLRVVTVLQPIVAGEDEKGAQMPLRVTYAR
ncbi:cytochrome P450 [Gloeophyllum trabeum ATCC 11539]|uniref:Cytochrome P450 n=1 Tax=Gloeophyllum trabeum (strain ATCC 11539 / FP-39264 / Madison 617) TaxID=670483 RepID=S7PV92_GLOTA|nr:cytochrome P450 [Gloeophyllum trabeum ATCC 11539]EPQ51541.1 cytochrome P450 [Gloeophyllum trabeum ATCC 11539]